ncbi:hypothetical protein AB1Y20_022860 [Prymnesium parvum]|uniref:Carbohydrate kinase PfkB domain-containing protein n=1 Tax=Prymnesium parvum TaxID=97485 RepID=A0AB34JC80_PRYPA
MRWGWAAMGLGAAVALLGYLHTRRRRRRRVLVVGSINVDLYQRTTAGSIKFSGRQVNIAPIKGMTLPASSFIAHPKIKAQAAVGSAGGGGAEEFVLTMDGPFEQKTGGKGANTAAAAGQTFACDLFGNMGKASERENAALLRDLHTFGAVGTEYISVLPDCPTGTAYILLFEDNDNAILLLGGANQQWPPQEELEAVGGRLYSAISDSVAVMLQREERRTPPSHLNGCIYPVAPTSLFLVMSQVPEYVNVSTARLASSLGKPVVMDCGGTDAPLDAKLMPYISVMTANESELTFISGIDTQFDGCVQKNLVREAVGVLKSKFAATGNPRVEVLVTLGPLGSMHFGADWTVSKDIQETHIGRFALTTADGKPKDTTGAGDCYRGSFVAARYGEGRSVTDAMVWAAAASACSVEVEGAMPSMPPRAEIERRCSQSLLAVDEF